MCVPAKKSNSGPILLHLDSLGMHPTLEELMTAVVIFQIQQCILGTGWSAICRCSLVCRSFDLCQLATPRPPPCRSTSFLFPFSAFRLGLNFCSHVFSLACLCRAAIRLSLFLSRFCWCACW
uniref:Uncharacterized protein n=1 Tax=Aegilops tauschii subsp. strangulata TaxID=200361 RepID=A0A452Y616_AEGTS